MNQIKIPRGWEISENEITSESALISRRQFLKGSGTIALYGAALYMGCSPRSGPVEQSVTLNKIEEQVYPAKHNSKYILDRDLTVEKIAASYNNFYEFARNKEDPSYLAQKLETRPWTLEVKGLVGKPAKFDIDDLLKFMPIEERLYRFRCVEAWAMAVPWTGFPISTLIKMVEPKGEIVDTKEEAEIKATVTK